MRCLARVGTGSPTVCRRRLVPVAECPVGVALPHSRGRSEAARRRAGAMHPIDQSLDIIIPERLRARHWEGFSATMQTGRSRYGEGRMLSVPAIRKDDAPISVEFTIVPFANDSGQMTGIAAIMCDTTTRLEEP